MFKSFEDAQKFGKDNLDVAGKSFAAVSQGLTSLATDAADYSKKSFEASTATFEKLLGAKSLEKAFEIQTEFARSAYEDFVAHSTRMGEALTNLAKEGYKPFEGLFAKAAK